MVMVDGNEWKQGNVCGIMAGNNVFFFVMKVKKTGGSDSGFGSGDS